MAEFGAAAKVGKAFRQGFANIIKSMRDQTLAGRLTGLMKQINANGSGLRGQRTFEILNNRLMLEGFEFNKSVPLDGVFYPPYNQPVFDANRDIATWTVPDFSTANLLSAPLGASHFKLVLALSVLSNFEYQNALGAFEFTNPDENTMNQLVLSPEIPIGGMVGSDTVLTADLGIGNALPPTVGVLAAAGIVFYQELNGDYYELTSGNSMKIIAVG